MLKNHSISKALLAASVLLLAGCNLNSTPETPQVVFITPTGGGSVNAPPVIDASPIAPPTATTSPDVALQIAQRYLLNGYYEDAVAAYQVVLDEGDSVPQDLRSAAGLGLGQAAVREGLFVDAVNALTSFIAAFPQDTRLPQAYFLRGDAYLGLSLWDNAVADFQQYLTLRPRMIDSYALERIGDAQLALGQTSSALASYAASASASRSLTPQMTLREKVAQLYLNAGQVTQAIAQYDALLNEATGDSNRNYRATIEYDAASALVNSGDLTNGLARMTQIFDNYPDRPEAYQAMNVLVANGQTLDDLARGQVAFNYGDYPGTIEALNAFSTSHAITEVPADLFLMLGRAYREIGNSAAALTAFQTIVTQFPRDKDFGPALLEQGRTKFIAGDISGAIQQYLDIADNYSYLPEAPEALWRAGYLYATNGDPGTARQTFERLAVSFPNTEQARSGLLMAASAAYNAKDTDGALSLYTRLAAASAGDDQASAYLWVGKLQLQNGNTAASNTAFQQAAQASPDSYFSARAQDIIMGRTPFQSPASEQFQFDDATQLAQAEDWLRQKFSITQTGALWQLSPTLQADPRLLRGTELWAVSAYEEADNEFYDLLDSTQNDGLASYQLAIYLRGIGAYPASITGAANVIKAANVATLDAPPYIARMRYPVYYLDVVQDVSQRYHIDPLLLFSLIRHESLFDTYATASAGEKGLTQVVPSTGDYIASQLQWPNYQHSDLFRPYAGVEFGAYYLNEQLQRFDNNVPASLAGYNAGPGRAANWLALSGGDPDLFMTAIDIDSTRLYVQRIYSFYSVYRALYGT